MVASDKGEAIQVKNLDTMAQQCWEASSLASKKAVLLEMVESFQHKAKQDKFVDVVEQVSSPSKADRLAAQLALNNTDAVIK